MTPGEQHMQTAIPSFPAPSVCTAWMELRMNILLANKKNDKTPETVVSRLVCSSSSSRVHTFFRHSAGSHPWWEGWLCPFSLSASAMKSAGGDEERQGTGGKLVDPKWWIQAKLDFWMPWTVLQCRCLFRIIYFMNLPSYTCTCGLFLHYPPCPVFNFRGLSLIVFI